MWAPTATEPSPTRIGTLRPRARSGGAAEGMAPETVGSSLGKGRLLVIC
jgi:hypothetical protein